MDKRIKNYYPWLQNLDNIIEDKTYVLFASNIISLFSLLRRKKLYFRFRFCRLKKIIENFLIYIGLKS